MERHVVPLLCVRAVAASGDASCCLPLESNRIRGLSSSSVRRLAAPGAEIRALPSPLSESDTSKFARERQGRAVLVGAAPSVEWKNGIASQSVIRWMRVSDAGAGASATGGKRRRLICCRRHIV